MTAIPIDQSPASSRPADGGHAPARSMLGGVLAFARREFRDAVASRWFLLYTVAFTVLAVGVSFMSLSGVGTHGFAGFSRTAAGLLNLIMLVVPLMALTAGAGTIAGERERGTLLYLLAQPVSRTQVLLGKYLGLATSLVCSLCIGFGVSAGVLAWRAGGVGVGAFVLLVACTALLALAMLSVGVLISVVSRRTSVATGLALFVWLTLVFVSDLGLMASSLLFKLRVQEVFGLAIINPLQSFKMAVIVNMNASLDVLGPVGAYATHTIGAALPLVLIATIAAWAVLPLAAAVMIFARRKSV
jgi:Cu-processing system permease protein